MDIRSFKNQDIDRKNTDIEMLREENARLKKEIEELKAAKAAVLTRALDDYLANAKKDQLINFDDANYEYFWTAECGDVCLWKVPNELYALESPDGSGGSRVQQAFQYEQFGEEWGCLSSFGVRTMTLADLKEADGWELDDECCGHPDCATCGTKEEERPARCFECGKEGTFVWEEGKDDWLCEKCADICHQEEYICANCGYKFANEEEWAGACDEHSCHYCECDCEDCANDELNAAIDASGNALH